MPVRWKQEYQPFLIVEKIESLRSINANDQVQFSGFAFKEYETVLFRMLDFPDSIPEVEARSILWQSLKTVGKQPVVVKALLAELNKRVEQYLQRPVSRFVLLTSLSVRCEQNISPIRIGQDQVILGKVPLRFYQESRPLLEKASLSLALQLPENYLSVRVHVSARSTHEAANKALGHLDLLRGLWNLFYSQGHSIRWTFGGKPPRINRIVTGPIHTLHSTTGKLLDENTWWYDPTFIKPISTKDIGKDWDEIADFVSNIRTHLSKSNYSNILEEAIIRYARALDEHNLNSAYVHLWSVLELLTYTVEASYKVTVRRAAFVFDDYSYYSQVLNHLREYRNQFIHHFASDSGVETYIYQLKNIVEHIIRFHLYMGLKFSSIQDVAEFLDMPHEFKRLEGKKDMLKKAFGFRSYKWK